MFPELAAAITAGRAAKDSAKFLLDVSNEFDKAELKLRIIELVGQITELNTELLELKQKLSVKEVREYERGVYWDKGKVGQGDPYCPRCLEHDDKGVHMNTEGGMFTGGSGTLFYACRQCRTCVTKN